MEEGFFWGVHLKKTRGVFLMEGEERMEEEMVFFYERRSEEEDV